MLSLGLKKTKAQYPTKGYGGTTTPIPLGQGGVPQKMSCSSFVNDFYQALDELRQLEEERAEYLKHGFREVFVHTNGKVLVDEFCLTEGATYKEIADRAGMSAGYMCDILITVQRIR